MDGIILTPLDKIYHPKGEILKIIKKSDTTFNEFGEAYFSTISQGDIKGWKKHTKMILNLVVVIGEIEFVIYNENKKEFFNVKISQDNYKRLTVKPGLWMAFRGVESHNMLFNLSNIEHNPDEAINTDLYKIDYKWTKK
jgi:dTDP-4-dehydrorhamnose 3,5-epimerase|tara:strand:- start:245 stop:661 length:417 start_codon:yes stop_codon:yes gene_type:complete